MPDLRAHRNACTSGHRNSTIRTIAASPGGNFVASIADDGYLIVWDERRGEVVRVLGDGPDAEEVLSSCAFLADVALAVGSGRRVLILEPRSGRVFHEVPCDGAQILRVADWQVICPATEGADGCVLIDCRDGTVVTRFPNPDAERGGMSALGMCRSEDLALFVIEGDVHPWRQTLLAMDARDGSVVWRRDLRQSTRCCLSPGGILALASGPEILSVICARSGRVLRTHELADGSRWLASLAQEAIAWDAPSGLLRVGSHPTGAALDPETGAVERLSVDHADDLPIACDLWHRDHAEDRPPGARPSGFPARFWSCPGPSAKPLALALSADGGAALVAYGDGRVLAWDLAARRLLSRHRFVAIGSAEPVRGELICAKAARGGGRLVVADHAGIIRWFDAGSTRASREIDCGLPGITALAPIEEGGMVVVVQGPLWGGGRMLRCLDQDGRVSWSRDDLRSCGDLCDIGGGALLIACNDHLLRLDVADGRTSGAPLRPITASGRMRGREATDMLDPLVIAAAATTVAVGGQGSALVIDLAAPATATHLPMQYDGVAAVALSPDGQLRAVGEHYHRAITFEDARTGEKRVLYGHLDRVTALAFTPDATRLVSAGADGQLLVWEVASGRLLTTYRCLRTPAGEEQRWEVVDEG